MAKESEKLFQNLSTPLYVLLAMWVVHVLQLVLPWLTQFGVIPRTLTGLKGIFFSPLLHGDWGHLISNSVPFLFLSIIVFSFYRKISQTAFWMIYLLTGLSVWLFARPTIHIGASGVVYGLLAFVFWMGIFQRSIKSIALALIVLFYYGSFFLGILPGQEGISWESHLLGGLVGIFAAFWFKDQGKEEREPYSWEVEPEEEPESFLDQETFLKTRRERELQRRSEDRRLW